MTELFEEWEIPNHDRVQLIERILKNEKVVMGHTCRGKCYIRQEGEQFIVHAQISPARQMIVRINRSGLILSTTFSPIVTLYEQEEQFSTDYHDPFSVLVDIDDLLLTFHTFRFSTFPLQDLEKNEKTFQQIKQLVGTKSVLSGRTPQGIMMIIQTDEGFSIIAYLSSEHAIRYRIPSKGRIEAERILFSESDKSLSTSSTDLQIPDISTLLASFVYPQ